MVVRPGPLPDVHVVRYAVISGKEGPKVEKPLPFVVRADMLYRIRVDVHGSDFAILAQGQIIDFWTEIGSSMAASACFATAAKRLGLGGWKSRINTTRWADCVPTLRPTELRAETGLTEQ